jgi:hypothetical protein
VAKEELFWWGKTRGRKSRDRVPYFISSARSVVKKNFVAPKNGIIFYFTVVKLNFFKIKKQIIIIIVWRQKVGRAPPRFENTSGLIVGLGEPIPYTPDQQLALLHTGEVRPRGYILLAQGVFSERFR